MPYSRSSHMESRNWPVCSGVHTMTGLGFWPVRFHSSTRSGVQTSALGRFTAGSSTIAAQLVAYSPRLMPLPRNELRVALMRCIVAALVIFRLPLRPSRSAALAHRQARRVRRRSSFLPADRTHAVWATGRASCNSTILA
ncbi:hypothetical protein [Streptomyces zagrosensis]|uniref:hypothetical protein n=1 Tax=Streptomyces zagrosensis TaxID=1042984 RepID=UPI0016085916